MWIMMNDSFVSIVKPAATLRKSEHILCVRARTRSDLEDFFEFLGEEIAIECTPERDYAYRTFQSRYRVSKALVERIHSLDYENFKNSVDDDGRHDAYEDVWMVMAQWGRRQRDDDDKTNYTTGIGRSRGRKFFDYPSVSRKLAHRRASEKVAAKHPTLDNTSGVENS